MALHSAETRERTTGETVCRNHITTLCKLVMVTQAVVAVLLAAALPLTVATFHRDEYCAKFEIDARHTDRRSDGLGHGLEIDVDRIVK